MGEFLVYATVWPFFDGDDTNICGFTFSNRGSLSMDFLLATGELDAEWDVAVAAFLANINILDVSLDASGDFLSSLSEVLLSIKIVLRGLVVVAHTDFLVVLVTCFLENAEWVAARTKGGGGLPLKGE